MKLPNPQSETEFDAAFDDSVWLLAATSICTREKIPELQLVRAGGSEHIVFFVGDTLVLKIFRPFRNCFEREKHALETIAGLSEIKIPAIVRTGEFEGFPYIFMTRLSGEKFTRAEWLKEPEKRQCGFIAKLAMILRKIHDLSASFLTDDWSQFVADRASTFIQRQIAAGVNSRVIDALPRFLDENLTLIPVNGEMVFMHADVHFGNLTINQRGGVFEPFGLFDFADSRRGYFEYDFLAVGVLMIQGQREVQREFFKAYGYAEHELDEEMRRRIMMIMMLYETADLRRYALRLRPEAVGYSLERLEREIWAFV